MSAPEETADVVPVVTVVPDHVTGEVLDLRDADDSRIADFIGDGDDLIKLVKVHQDHARAELRRRMDLDLSWTRRIGDPTGPFQWEAKCPSPDADTEYWLPDELEEVIVDLVERGVVGEAAADGAMKRTVTLTVDVPVSSLTPLQAVVDGVKQGEGRILLAGRAFRVVKAESEAKAYKPGVTKLRKVPAAREAVDAIVKVDTPTRRVSLKKIERGA